MSDDDFVSVGGPKKYFKYKDCNEGDVLVNKGEYMGSGTDKFGNPNHDFKELETDEIVCLNSAGGLNRAIEKHIVEGDVVRVIYKGMTTLDKGPMAGKDCHTFDVLKSKNTSKKIADNNGTSVSLDDLE